MSDDDPPISASTYARIVHERIGKYTAEEPAPHVGLSTELDELSSRLERAVGHDQAAAVEKRVLEHEVEALDAYARKMIVAGSSGSHGR